MHILCVLVLLLCTLVRMSRADCFGWYADGEPAQPLRPALAQTWKQLQAGCAAAYYGSTLLRDVSFLSDQERAACGQSFVPYGVYEKIDLTVYGRPPVSLYWSGAGGREELEAGDIVNLTYVPHGSTPGVAVIDLATGRWGFVPSTQTFECALCQKARTDRLTTNYNITILPDNVTLLLMNEVVFEVVLVDGAQDSSRNATTTDLELLALESELGKLLDLESVNVDFSRSDTDHQGRDELYFHITSASHDHFDAILAQTNLIPNCTLADRYRVDRVIQVSPCPVEDVPAGYQRTHRIMAYGNEIDERISILDDFQVLVDPESELLSQRQCLWDDETSKLAWTPRRYWRVIWKNCSKAEQDKDDETPQNMLTAIHNKRLLKRLQSFQGVSLNCTILDEVAEVVNLIVKKNNDLPNMFLPKLYSVLALTSPNDITDFCLLNKKRLHLIVSKLDAVQPVIGFRLTVDRHDLGAQTMVKDPIAGVHFVSVNESESAANLHIGPALSGAQSPDFNTSAYDSQFQPSGFQTYDSNIDNNNSPSQTDFLTADAPKDSYLPLNESTSLEWATLISKGDTWEELATRDWGLESCDVLRQISDAIDESTRFAVSVSEDLIAEFQQLAITVANIQVHSSNQHSVVSVYEPHIHIELSTINSPPDIYTDYDGYFIDITYLYVDDEAKLGADTIYTSCVSWNPLTEAWTTKACKTRKALLDSLTVCRCRAKHMTQNGSTLTGTFAIKKAIDSSVLNDDLDVTTLTIFQYAGSNKLLIALTVLELGLSLFGLLSFVLTAICYKPWREDMGHKILLQMVFAITLNLAFGFTTDYVHFDTESAGCIVVGVLRHYSFLAMFMWMLVLSGLQMKRLMTVAGAKATSHLILKVALFAWGVPLLPIVVLLSYNARIYRSDRYDRGYCYPEGLVFQLTVQAPAAVILVVNLLIFVAIVRHIFECCSGEKITRHTKNEKAQQLRRVATSVFIFFLFGFTWVLHYLSEQRLIKSEFLFEYLFLMTATTHISVLSLFFVILDDKARAFWWQILQGKPITEASNLSTTYSTTRRKATSNSTTRRKTTSNSTTRRKTTSNSTNRRKTTSNSTNRKMTMANSTTRNMTTSNSTTRRKSTAGSAKRKMTTSNSTSRRMTTVR